MPVPDCGLLAALPFTPRRVSPFARNSGVAHYECSNGQFAACMHYDQKKGAIVAAETEAGKDASEATLNDLCMHIVVFNPDGLSRDDIADDTVHLERAIRLEEVKGKPGDTQEENIQGKLSKIGE